MTTPVYDFYAEMLECHAEIGYLIVVLIAVLCYDAALVTAVTHVPGIDVYRVPGVDACGSAALIWGGAPASAVQRTDTAIHTPGAARTSAIPLLHP